MKILALTDIHGSFKIAAAIVKKEAADVVIIGGDLTNVGTVKEAEEALDLLENDAARLLCIAGNMDLPQHEQLFERRGLSLNARGIRIDDIGFFGVSSAPYSKLQTPYEISEEELSQRIYQGYQMVKGASKKVFVPHAPPYGTKLDIIHSGIHVGSTAVREFIEETQPDAVICGHIHEARGIDRIDKSQIVNCGAASHGNYAVIIIDQDIKIKILQHPFNREELK
jgi:Icc-related predicted phosphoesterase